MMHIFLIGYPIGHSLSPAIHNAALRAVGLDWRYELMETRPDEVPAAVARLRAADCAGANVTIPYKERIGEWLDGLGESARRIGAVNTVIKRDGKLIGENTDGIGFMQALRDAHIDPHRARVVILGAGGAARAIAFALAEAGAQSIVVLNRTPRRARLVVDLLSRHFPQLELGLNLAGALRSADMIVNATPVGMSPKPYESPLPTGSGVPRGTVVFDLVYCPAETQFLRDAARVGARPLGGLGMLVHQGAATFKLWTGREPPLEVMFDAARLALGESGGI